MVQLLAVLVAARRHGLTAYLAALLCSVCLVCLRCSVVRGRCSVCRGRGLICDQYDIGGFITTLRKQQCSP